MDKRYIRKYRILKNPALKQMISLRGQFYRKLFFLICIFLLISLNLHARTIGQLQGTILDSLNGEPVPNVRIFISQLNQSTFSDSLGRFLFMQLPAARYNLTVSKEGFYAQELKNVLVIPNSLSWQEISLLPFQATTPEVVISTSREKKLSPMMEKTTFFSKEDLASLPYQDALSAVGLSSGVVKQSKNPRLFYVRGGRLGEASVYFDGILQNSPMDYALPINFDADWMETVVLKSGFNARYGNALSGVMHLLTTEPGGEKLQAKISAESDAGIHTFGTHRFSSQVSGPLLPATNTLRFSANLNVEEADDATPTYNFSARDGADSEKKQAFFKLVYQPGYRNTLKFGALLHKGSATLYSSKRSYGAYARFRRDFEGDILGYDIIEGNSSANSGRQETQVGEYYLRFHHLISKDALFSTQLNYYTESEEVGDKTYWRDFERYRQNSSIGADAFGLVNLPGNPYNSYWREELQYLETQMDVEIHWHNHLIQVGAFMRRYSLKMLELQPELLPENDATLNIIGFDANELDNPALVDFLSENPDWLNSETDGIRHPWMAGLYLQDDFHDGPFGLSLGLRLDYFNPNTKAIKDLENPFIKGTSELNYTSSISRLEFQPRVSFQYKVSEKFFVHSHVGRYTQMPPLRLMVAGDALLKRYMQGGRGLRLSSAPNPNLKPEKTTTYEIGAQLEPLPWVWFDFTLFYKQTRDLIQTLVIDASDDGSLPLRYIYGNSDFGTIKGLELSFETLRQNRVKFKGSYSLQFASGTNSTTDELFDFFRRYASSVKSESATDVVPNTVHALDFERRHVGNLQADVLLSARTNLNLLYQFSSGVVYTPHSLIYDAVTDLTSPEIVALGSKNSARAIWNHQLDLKLSHRFELGENSSLMLYLTGINILNLKQVLGVYETTGQAGDAGYKNSSGFQERIDALVERISDPQLREAERQKIEKAYREHYKEQERSAEQYGVARQVRFGFTLSF